MKLIVQIPCFNEEDTLRQTVAEIPRKIPGFDEVEILVIDDGSSDSTLRVAKEAGVDYIVRHKLRGGLARAFRTGIDACLRLGADVIVNTDGDNQYPGADIPKLCGPILSGAADIVVGDRGTQTLQHFSPLKKRFQKLGSGVVRRLSNTDVPDVVSGFRALSRDAALQMNIVSSFSYTIEMIIQAGRKRIAIASVPVGARKTARASRLFESIPRFIADQLTTIIRMYAMFQPLRVFFFIGFILSIIGAIPMIRFGYFFLSGEGGGHIQSLVLGGVFLMMGFITFMIGLVADLISFNRQLLEMTLERVKTMEFRQREEADRN